MGVHIENIGNQKIAYKDARQINFSDLSDYLLLAKKSISTFANKFYHGLAPKMLHDEDAISNIAYAIMLADWRYDENHEGKRQIKKTRYSYRNQCALWAIQTYVTKSSKNKKNTALSLDHSFSDDDEHQNQYKYIVDPKDPEPSKILESYEAKDNMSQKIEVLLNTEGVTEIQKTYIKLYYIENLTYAQIGKRFSLTREAIRQSIIKGIETIRRKNTHEQLF